MPRNVCKASGEPSVRQWLEGCAGSKVRCAPTDEPASILHAPRAEWFVIPTIRAFAATHACPDPNPSSGALRVPDADANHGSQVGPRSKRLSVSEGLDPLLPVELTLRPQFMVPDGSPMW